MYDYSSNSGGWENGGREFSPDNFPVHFTHSEFPDSGSPIL